MSHLIGTREASKVLGVSRTTFQRLVASGDLEPETRIPGLTGAMLFDRSDVNYLAAQRKKGK